MFTSFLNRIVDVIAQILFEKRDEIRRGIGSNLSELFMIICWIITDESSELFRTVHCYLLVTQHHEFSLDPKLTITFTL